MRLHDIDIYLVTDPKLSRKTIFKDAEAALDAGCRIIQYREKEKPIQERIEEARRLSALCRGRAIFIVNDDPSVALESGADGVHLGQEDEDISSARSLLGKKIIGITAHDEKEAAKAQREGADYIGLSPIFVTSTKHDAGEACGIEMIRKVSQSVSIPIVAIGGITKDNVQDVMKAGAHSAAVISAIVCSEDVATDTKVFRKLIMEARGWTKG